MTESNNFERGKCNLIFEGKLSVCEPQDSKGTGLHFFNFILIFLMKKRKMFQKAFELNLSHMSCLLAREKNRRKHRVPKDERFPLRVKS